MMPEQQDLVEHYLELKRLKAVMDAEDVNNEGKDSIITAFSEAVNAAFLRIQRIVRDIDTYEKQCDKTQHNSSSR